MPWRGPARDELEKLQVKQKLMIDERLVKAREEEERDIKTREEGEKRIRDIEDRCRETVRKLEEENAGLKLDLKRADSEKNDLHETVDDLKQQSNKQENEELRSKAEKIEKLKGKLQRLQEHADQQEIDSKQQIY